ncbi:MAG: hypothetical protein ACRDJM_09315, partial [Actinomycetota bacterium]
LVRRIASAAALGALAAASLVLAPAPPAGAVPVATNDTLYEAFGRVFPDPHGCARGLPGRSPWAKGRICAAQFLQFDDVIAGLRYLESRFDGLLQVVNLHEGLANDPEFTEEELQSAGLPQEDFTRDRRDLHVIKVTDRSSKIPEASRKHFAYSMSIHGIERAGIEGGIRAIEDLVTWTACERDAAASPSCADEGVGPGSPKRILEAFNPPEGPTAGEVLREAVVFFVLSNPDGWHRGEATQGGVFFQRYNGNGMDGNRDWPALGYVQQEYTPGSEPETRGYGKYLLRARQHASAKRFAGAIDLHGMLGARSFSFTLLGAGQRDYRKNAITVQTAIMTFRDSEARLTWSPLVAPSAECPGEVSEPASGGRVPMCTDQWGTVWDTINYQVTGSFGDWMDSPIGLDAVGIDNEMAYSHLTFNNAYEPGLAQLHVDGNKGLIYAQIAALLHEKPVSFVPEGKVAYLYDPRRIRNGGGKPAAAAASALPAQEVIQQTAPDGRVEVPFTVKGPSEGVRNGGLTIHATSGNVRGISPNANASFIVDYCGPPDHPGDEPGCHEVVRYFNQSGLYLQAGARIDLNDPRPGPYRIRSDDSRSMPVDYRISFSVAPATPVPEQLLYDVSRMDFFAELNRYIPDAKKLVPVTAEQVVAQPNLLHSFDTVVVAGEFPSRVTAPLRAFAAGGGALVLTDGAMAGLPGLVPAIGREAITRGWFYAGWMNFDDGEGATYDRHHLARGVNMPGTAEGGATLAGVRYANRHQTYEPVPIGYFVSPSGSSNASCGSDLCDSPNWIVNEQVWRAAGGTVAAKTHVNRYTDPRPQPGQSLLPPKSGVSLGEIKLGKGVVRVAGALLPDPTQQNYHPYGLASYALTYTGYQVFENLVKYRRRFRPVVVLPARAGRP